MAKLNIEGGTESFIDIVILEDDTVSTGAGKTGIVFSGVTCYYQIQGQSTWTAVTLTGTGTLGTYTSGFFKEADATNAPGAYQFHPPNLSIALGYGTVTFILKGSGFKENRFQYQDGVSLTAIGTTMATKLADIHLDHMFAVAVTDEIVDGSWGADVVSAAGDWSDYDPTLHSLEANYVNLGEATDTDFATDIDAIGQGVITIDAIVDSITARLPAALTVAGLMKSDVVAVNAVALQGAGTVLDPWRPA